MQEEVENRSINLVVTASRISTRVMIDGIRSYLKQSEQEKHQLKTQMKVMKAEEKVRQQNEQKHRKEKLKQEGPRGKQTVKQLLRKDGTVKQLPVQGEHLKEFEKILRKYGVDFAIMKDTKGASARYLAFFKAKDELVLQNVLKDCTQKQLEKGKSIPKKPSILKQLAKFKEAVLTVPKKLIQKEKDLSR